MDAKLLNITTQELLDKFGAGNHKPGSGSAAAFQGMIAAKLLVTVISLTNEEKRRPFYSKSLPRLLEIGQEIQERLFPELTRLFHIDSIQFDKTIKLRQERDLEVDLYKKNRLSKQALEELKIAVEIPLEIAGLSIELAEMAEFVFDNGFQSARGDSHVALSGAVSGLAGSLSIIQLNLTLFGSNEFNWTKNIITKTAMLKSIYQELQTKAIAKIEVLELEVANNALQHSEVNKFLSEIKLEQKITNSDVEDYASKFQRIIWKHRGTIWKKNKPEDYLQILNPSKVFKKVLGYEFHNEVEFKKSPEIAGLIDQPNRMVLISKEYPKPTQNFTAAHELGHAILHKQDVLHRDKAIDGSNLNIKRDAVEIQADKFATHFLMPSELVKRVFNELFGTEKLILNDDSTFFLTKGRKTQSELRRECRNSKGLAIKLASTEYYFDQPTKSISEIFNVSIGAMAIRLEELSLFEF